MAIEQVPGGLWIPTPIPWGAANPSFTSMLINASAEKAAFIIQVPKSGTLNYFEFLTGTVSQSPANGLKLSFQDVDLATGDPDGTADQYRVLAHPISANTWQLPPGALTSDGTDSGTKRTVTRGELLACVVEFESFAVSDSVNVRTLNLAANAFMGNTPYPTHFTAAWAKLNDGAVMALVYDDNSYPAILGVYPFAQIQSYTYNVDTGGADEYGLAFSMPSDVRVGAFYVRANIAGNADLVLYDKDLSTVLETMSIDANVRVQAATQYHLARCSTDRLLYANETYILSLKPTTTTDVTLYTGSPDSDVISTALDGGNTWGIANRLNGGTWTYTKIERPFMGIVVTGIDHEIGGSPSTGWEGDA